jgi:excisionase family DNA binding protein
MEQGQFLKLGEVAKLLQLSPRQVLNLAKDDAKTPIPHIKVNGRSLRFRKSDLEKWFEKNLISAIWRCCVIPVFITPEGVVLSLDKQQTPSLEVETKEPALFEIAAIEARKQSTTGKETK